MPRIPYLPADLNEPTELLTAIRKRRGGELLNLDRMLLHSPLLAEGWNHMLGAVRTKFSPATQQLRELAICGVAIINHAPYEFAHHAPVFMAAGGSQAQAEALRDWQSALSSPVFSAAQLAVMRLTDEMTKNVKVSDATFADAKAAIGNEQDMIELIATIAAYNMVSRFLVATGIGLEEAKT